MATDLGTISMGNTPASEGLAPPGAEGGGFLPLNANQCTEGAPVPPFTAVLQDLENGGFRIHNPKLYVDNKEVAVSPITVGMGATVYCNVSRSSSGSCSASLSTDSDSGNFVNVLVAAISKSGVVQHQSGPIFLTSVVKCTKTSVVTSVDYDEKTHRLTYKTRDVWVCDDPSDESQDQLVFEAKPVCTSESESESESGSGS